MKKLLLVLLGLNLFFLQSYLLRFPLFTYTSYVQELLLVLTALVFVLHRGFFQSLKALKKHPILWIFSGLTALSLFVVPLLSAAEALTALKFLFYAVLFGFLVLEIYQTELERKDVLALLSYGAVFFGLFSVLYNGLGYNVQTDLRLSGPLDSAVYLAFYLAPAVLFFGLRFFRQPRVGKELFFFLIAGALLLATRSFGSIGAVGLLFCVELFLNAKLVFFRALWFKVLILIGAVLFLTATFYVKILPTLQTEYSSLDERGEIWQTSAELLSTPESFLLGVGFGQFQAHYEENVVEVLGREPLDYKVLQPHNIFLWFWMHFGFLGFLFALWSFGMLLWRILVKKPSSESDSIVCAVLFLFFIHGLIDAPFMKNDLLFLLILFLEWALGPLLLRQLEVFLHKCRQLWA